MILVRRPLGCVAPLLASILGSVSLAAHAQVSTEFSVTGAVTTTRTYTLPTLQALPPITQTDTFLQGSTPQVHTYTGASLWGVLNASGIVTTGAKNDILNRYVLATGSDGYKTVFSMGELNPSFGNQPDLVAYAETLNGTSAPLGSDGFARTTAPGDSKGGRYVSNLTSLDVRSSGSIQTGTGGGVSTSLAVSGTVLSPASFDLAGLEALPAMTENISGIAYTGVSLWSFLSATAGLQLGSAKNDVLAHYVVATGSDGYKALFSLGEIDPDFGGDMDMIAYEENGQPLTTDGFARIVVPGDVKQGRFVSNLVSLEVFNAAPVPEPATTALMALGIAALVAMLRGWVPAKPALVP